mgnify:CR=1 FL=1
MKEVVIAAAVRTPLGAFNGSLAAKGATDLGARVITESIRRAGADPNRAKHGSLGTGLPRG